MVKECDAPGYLFFTHRVPFSGETGTYGFNRDPTILKQIKTNACLADRGAQKCAQRVFVTSSKPPNYMISYRVVKNHCSRRNGKEKTGLEKWQQ